MAAAEMLAAAAKAAEAEIWSLITTTCHVALTALCEPP
jgi:hypothetical protein